MADKLLIRPTHGDRAGAGSASGHVPFRAPRGADQYLGHARTTNTKPRAPVSGTGGSQDSQSVLEARHPTSRHGNLTDQPGHDLTVRLKARGTTVLT